MATNPRKARKRTKTLAPARLYAVIDENGVLEEAMTVRRTAVDMKNWLEDHFGIGASVLTYQLVPAPQRVVKKKRCSECGGNEDLHFTSCKQVKKLSVKR